MTDIATRPVFVQRCRICGYEVMTEWGPETHTRSDEALRDHISRHSFWELQSYAMKAHFGATRV